MAAAAALAVATMVMEGGLLPDFTCMRCAVRRSPHAHKEPYLGKVGIVGKVFSRRSHLAHLIKAKL